mgnify:CR=1 FL=1
MDVLVIKGGQRLKGDIFVSGAKNAALPLMCASLLSREPVVLKGMPNLTDVHTLNKVLAGLGVTYDWSDDKSTLMLGAKRIRNFTAPYELVSKMRASVLVLGPLLARFGKGIVSLPGGCAIGARPVDVLLDGLRALGAKIDIKDGYIHAKAEGGLKGADIHLPKPAVTGTENLMMAATLAKGVTRIHGAAKEPEVTDLAQMLSNMGAEIKGAGTDTITIDGRDKLYGVTYTVMPDRIEAGTYILAAAMLGDGVTVHNTVPDHYAPLLELLKKSGASIEADKDRGRVHVGKSKGFKPLDVQTQPYPGFPTDLQAQMMAYLTQCKGESTITENIYENRFMHVLELKRMDANLTIEGSKVIIKGGESLKGAPVMATDLRASASLVLAALVADGQTIIRRVYHLDRGYDRLEEKLGQLGADVKRMDEKDLADLQQAEAAS